jgi:carbonic anhydrase
MVLGHKRCGAVQGTLEALLAGERPDGDIGYLISEIAPAVEEVGLETPDVAERAMRAHVRRTVVRLREKESVAAAITAGRAQIVGASYDLDTGLVELQH